MFQADLRNKLLLNEFKDCYRLILLLVNEKKKIYEPSEEMSYVLEYKVYYFLSILLFKNAPVQELLINDYKLFELIEEKCEKYFDLMTNILESRKSKTGISDQKIESMLKTVSKLYEIITFLCSGEKGNKVNHQRLNQIKGTNSYFLNLYNLMMKNDQFIQNFEFLFTTFLWIKKLLRSVEADDV